MPEAVASNSTPALEGQAKRKRTAPQGVPWLKADAPFEGLSPGVQRDFDAVEDMLRAHATMVTAMMETGDDFSLYSNGVHLIHQLIMLRLDEVAEHARLTIKGMHAGRHLKEPHDEELQDRISAMVAGAYSEAGVDMDLEKMADWDKSVVNLWVTATVRYGRELQSRLEGDTHLLSVGSLLPWLEMKIWREIAGVELSRASEVPAPVHDASEVGRVLSRLAGREDRQQAV